nr:J299 [uncultured bacterium]
MANGELQAVLAKAIDALPANQRAVLTLRDLAGQPLEEICNALDVSATNARVLLHRARLRVWAAVEAYQRGDNV